MRAMFGGPNKLIALTESGKPARTPTRIRGYATWWSWFCELVRAAYIRNQPVAFLRSGCIPTPDIITKDKLA